METTPKISVVTVSFNAHDVIEKTILSVIGQNYGNLEYLVIDGGSTDGTQEIVGKYLDRINHFVSEHDGGIYFGMNKGIDAATGDWVLFLNADDIFVDNNVLAEAAQFICGHPEAEVIYGNSEQVLEYGTYPVRPQEAAIGHKMAISHQATFVRRDLLLEHHFDTKYRYAADFEQLSSLYLAGRKFVHFDRMVARVEMRGGATFNNYEASAREMYSIIESRGVDIASERDKMIRHKRLVQKFKKNMPGWLANPLLRLVAKYYKPL